MAEAWSNSSNSHEQNVKGVKSRCSYSPASLASSVNKANVKNELGVDEAATACTVLPKPGMSWPPLGRPLPEAAERPRFLARAPWSVRWLDPLGRPMAPIDGWYGSTRCPRLDGYLTCRAHHETAFYPVKELAGRRDTELPATCRRRAVASGLGLPLVLFF